MLYYFWVINMLLNFLCEDPGALKTFYILKILKNILFIMLPAILIIYFSYCLIKKMLISNNDKILKSFIIKICITISIFFIPILFNAFYNNINTDYYTNINTCLENATIENIKYLEILKETEEYFHLLDNKTNKQNYNLAEKSLQNLKQSSDRELVSYYSDWLSNAKETVENATIKTECLAAGNVFQNGKCEKPEVFKIETETSDDPALNGGTGKVKLKKEYHYLQGNYHGSNSFCEGGSISARGCSVASTAIVISVLTDKKIDPLTISKTLKAKRKCNGSRHTYSVSAAKIYGLSSYTARKNDKEKVQRMINDLASGNAAVVARMAPNNGRYNTTSGHYIALVGAKKINGKTKVLVWDPATRKSSRDNYWADFDKDIMRSINSSASFVVIS